MKKSFFALSLLVAASTSACLETDEPQVETTDKITLNSLLPGAIQSNTLGNAALTSSTLYQMVASGDSGRSFAGYIVGCGLTSTQSITVSVGLNNYTFTGANGLASAWTTRALNTAELERTSACILARTNYNGTAVQISMRGQSSTLALVGTEATDYYLEEGAFYGDILNSNTSTNEHACLGYDGQNSPRVGDLIYRKCADLNTFPQTYCGFVYDGLCSDVCTTTVAGSGYYDNCNGHANVVTTFVQ